MSSILRNLRLNRLHRQPQTFRRYSTEPQYQAPTSAESTKTNPHREFYRSGTGRAVAWNFLVAMATFQVLYLGWLKLESFEVKKEKGEIVRELEGEVRGLVGGKK